MLDAERRMRLLIAYGREFVAPGSGKLETWTCSASAASAAASHCRSRSSMPVAARVTMSTSRGKATARPATAR
jgi:hypothetical protein